MPTVTITQGSKSFSVNFNSTFFVQEDTPGEIFWDADSQRNGVIKVWVQRGDTEPRIAFILPDWQVTINGVSLEQKFHDGIENLKGKEVSIMYKDYAFIFKFT